MDVEQLEALALSGDRDEALAQLVPGTDEHFHWTAIRHQHRGELAAVDRLLETWRTRHGTSEGLRRVERRQRILWADRDLPAHAEALAQALSVDTDHAREIEAAASRPTVLPEDLLVPQRILEWAIQPRHLDALTHHALPSLLAGAVGDLGPDRRRAMLQRLARTGLPGLVEAIARDLEDHRGDGFGALAIHDRLTLDELDALAYHRPDLRRSKPWVLARLRRMTPPDHVDLDHDDTAQKAFLDEVGAFVAELPPAFNSLKLHVLHHLLRCDERAGVVDRERVLRYLSLPREAPYAARRLADETKRRGLANLAERPGLGFPPVGDDEPFVRSLVGRLLEEEDVDAFSPYLDEAWLMQLLAETRLLGGDPADPGRWTRILGPDVSTALRDRVDVELLPTIPRRFGVDDPVYVDVALKNCWPLRVRVFRINGAAIGDHVPVNIDLDGLSPHSEEIREAKTPPMQRVRERIALPACVGRGTYVVELIGNGRASRAVIHKGMLFAIPRRSAAGLSVTIVDESGTVRPEATLRLGEREFRPREDGTITVPFGTGGKRHRRVSLCDGGLVVDADLVLPNEAYTLSASVLLDRQSLVAGRTAIAAVRVDLRVDGTPVSLALLEDPYVEITTVDRDGVPATRRQPVTLVDHRELEVPIGIPEQIRSLTLAIGGEVRVVSEQRTVALRDEVTSRVGTLHHDNVTHAAYLVRSTAGFVLRLIGKGGEPRPGRAVSVQLEHRLSHRRLEAVLATDAHGEIQLGELPGVHELIVSFHQDDRETHQQFVLHPFDSGPPPRTMVVTEGEPLAMPLGFGDRSAEPGWQLVELRGGAAVADHSARATVAAGVWRIDGLGAGTYELRGSEGPVVAIAVLPVASSVAGGWARSRDQLHRRTVQGAVLASARATRDGLEVTVTQPGPATRVCVVPTPFWPSPVWSSTLARPPRAPEVREARIRRTETASGRDIGDEYRYVLERTRHPRRPGTMLARPELLLNPFPLRSTTTTTQTAQEGDDYRTVMGGGPRVAKMAAAAMPEARSRRRAQRIGSDIDPAFAAHDFLARCPAPLVDLVPDASGRVHVPAADLAGATVVRVLCIDEHGSTAATVALPPAPVEVRDRRLSAALPADAHLREVRVLEPLIADRPLRLEGHGAQHYEVVGTFDALYRALCALTDDADLAQWSFLPRWAELDRDERSALYSEHACHELALFVHFRDPELFDEVVAPYLRNKLHPTFIDRVLLGEDLSAYLAPARLHRLNAIEIALLARSLSAGTPARDALVRRLADAAELRSTSEDRSRDDLLVEILLAGGSQDNGEPPLEADEPAPAPPRSDLQTRAGGAPSTSKGKRRSILLSDAASDGGGGLDGIDVMAVDLEERAEQAPLFRTVDQTREWAEHNWWQRPVAEQDASLVAPARLWRDFAAHTGDRPFLSPFLADAHPGFTAAVVALAITDLPFAGTEAVTEADDGGITLRTSTPALVARRALAPLAGEASDEALVGQSTYRGDDRWSWDGSVQREKPVTGELHVGVRYESKVVVSNPTAFSQVLDVLVQIPEGAMVVGGGSATRTHRLDLAAYGTETVTTAFYFPLPGTFTQVGARIARGDVLVAAAEGRTFTVSRDPVVADPDAWPHLSQHGSLDDVVRFLATRNLHRVDLTKLAWRMADREAFERVTATLADRLIFEPVLWGYALKHHDRPRLGEWLSMREGLADETGPLGCDLVTLDPRDHGRFQHLEYRPLVNARAHALGARRQVLNDGLDAQWRALLYRMATMAVPPPDAWLAAAQALLTMERAEEAGPLLAR
ncbi:MAG: hypothetical protein AAF602_05655, partial [Myxococcota bacterium]